MRQALVEVLMWPPGFPSAQLAEVSHAQSLLVFFSLLKQTSKQMLRLHFVYFSNFVCKNHRLCFLTATLRVAEY